MREVICSGLNVSTAELGLDSCPFLFASLYSRDFKKEETANDDGEVSPPGRMRIDCPPKGPPRMETVSFSSFTMAKSLRVSDFETQFI